MLFELLIVFLIIIFSYIFNYTDKLGINKQLIFIYLTFIIIITYKILYYYRVKKNINILKSNENFFDFSKEVNDFISSGIPDGINTSNIQEYKEEINKLQEQVGVMNEYLNEIAKIAKGEGDNQATSRLDEINIQASQQIQDYRINKLQQDIEQTTDLIKKAKLREDAKSFRKIPVYSSCIVSNADGSFNVDEPTPTTTNNLINNNLNTIIPSNNLNNNIDNNQVNTINNTNTNTNNNTNTIDFSKLLHKIQTDGLTINLDTTK